VKKPALRCFLSTKTCENGQLPLGSYCERKERRRGRDVSALAPNPLLFSLFGLFRSTAPNAQAGEAVRSQPLCSQLCCRPSLGALCAAQARSQVLQAPRFLLSECRGCSRGFLLRGLALSANRSASGLHLNPRAGASNNGETEGRAASTQAFFVSEPASPAWHVHQHHPGVFRRHPGSFHHASRTHGNRAECRARRSVMAIAQQDLSAGREIT
jgi:hypothetical protein